VGVNHQENPQDHSKREIAPEKNPIPSDRLSSFSLGGDQPGALDLEFLNEWFDSSSDAGFAVQNLLLPLQEYTNRPGKRVRSRMVMAGFELGTGGSKPTQKEETLLVNLSEMVEQLHSGSLVIDDIQDESSTRRGNPALHSIMGVGAAINAANWLYFHAADLIRTSCTAPGMELDLYRVFHKTMIRAHYGQSLDLAHDLTQVSRQRAYSISMATLGLKTGELMRMSSEFGAIAASADPTIRRKVSDFGQKFGVLLQMFNDLSEFKKPHLQKEAGASAHRPSWLWACAAKELGDTEFSAFQIWSRGISDPSNQTKNLEHPLFELALKRAMESKDSLIRELRADFGDSPTVLNLEDMAQTIVNSYV
jgi:geranylgeranyl pyrophosphate synthase